MKERGVVVCGLVLALVNASCSTPKTAIQTPTFAAWSQESPTPRRVCVLPFTNRTQRDDVGDLVRRSFAGHLSPKRFIDAELHEIDAKLPSHWEKIPARQMGNTLGCDALVYGIVTKANRLYLGLYSEISLEGGILVIDAETGQVLVEESHATRFRSGGIPLSPIGVVPSAVLNLWNVTEEQLVRAVDDLGRNLAATVPDLPSGRSVPRKTVVQANPAHLDDRRPLTAPLSAPDAYRLQVAAFRSPSEAQHAVQLLRDRGYQPEVTKPADTENPWHRVTLGPFPSATQARLVGLQIEQVLPFSPVVKSLAMQ